MLFVCIISFEHRGLPNNVQPDTERELPRNVSTFVLILSLNYFLRMYKLRELMDSIYECVVLESEFLQCCLQSLKCEDHLISSLAVRFIQRISTFEFTRELLKKLRTIPLLLRAKPTCPAEVKKDIDSAIAYLLMRT